MPWICLPKNPTATRSILIFKIFLLLIFSLSFISQLIYSYLTVRFFKEQITENSTRSQIQILRTHGHFFILSGIWSSIVLIIGIWGILSEYIGVLLGYVFMASAGIVFQVMGSLGSDDIQVAKLKVIGAVLDPMLIFLSLFFAHLIRSTNNSLFSLPIYRKSAVESRRSSFSEILSIGKDPRSIRVFPGTTLSSSTTLNSGSSRSNRSDQNHNQLHSNHHPFQYPRGPHLQHHHHHNHPVPSLTNENIFYARNPSLYY